MAPGFVPTDANAGAQQQAMIDETGARTPLGRVAGTEGVAAAIVAYASDLTRQVTGGYTAVDGGLSGP
ncbi:SDR family oxidoreductase [Saccharopolyspora sp. 5N102]|uniref:SDR family oxidoreductase n=1 Tax=Saccharopolyspora sp. 5N102 TaxID=3375155 RepID=UPI0037A2F04A